MPLSPEEAVRTYLGIGNCVREVVRVVLESMETRADRLCCGRLGGERGKVPLDSLVDELLGRS